MTNKEIHPIDQHAVNFEEFDVDLVLLDKKCDQILNIKTFIDNPFIPKLIADELLNFYNSSVLPHTIESDTRVSFVVADTEIFERKGKQDYSSLKGFSYLVGNAPAVKSWVNFKTHSFNLTKSIKDWFINHGIKDYNIRVDYKNIRQK